MHDPATAAGFLAGGAAFNGATLAVAILALAIAFFSAQYARRALYPPKRRLTVEKHRAVSLLSTRPGSLDGITVAHHDRILAQPHIATVVLANTGQFAISSDHFDRGRPIVIDFQVPILDIVDVAMSPRSGSSKPACALTGSEIQFGPDLLSRGQKFTLRVLTDGKPKILDPVANLVDTEIEVLAGEELASRTKKRDAIASRTPVVVMMCLLLALCMVLLLGMNVSTARAFDQALRTARGSS